MKWIYIVICVLFYAGAKKPKISIAVFDCRSTTTYSYDGEKVYAYSDFYKKNQLLSELKISKHDAKKLNAFTQIFYRVKGNEFFNNGCIIDGSHFKVYLNYDGQKKKVFIGNYYDYRADSLLTILNKYMDTTNRLLKYNGISYGDNIEYKKEIMKRNCIDTARKNFFLNEWCEIEN